jgi:anti-anti-sigma factor
VTGFDGRSGGFGVSVDFVDEQAVLGLRGVLDELALPGLEALFDAVITSGYPVIVVELADLDFMSPVGLTVITDAAERIAARDGQFSIRWPSAAMRKLLEGSGLATLVRTPPAELDATSTSTSTPTSADPNELARTSGRAIGVPTSDVVVDTALRLVVALARDIVGGADGVSVSIRRHGKLATVAASDQTISDMDASQYATGEGPCVDASFQGREFHVESLSTETRWPAFTPRALALGINAILSSPLTASDRPVGSMNIYSRSISAFHPADQRLASVLAVEASTILTDAGVHLADGEASERFQDALRTRQVIAQAQGVLMERDGISEDDAYTLLRIHSQRTGQSLHYRARDITSSALRRRTGRSPDQREPDDD